MQNKETITTWKLAAEAGVLFVGLPLLFYWNLIPLPKILALILVAGYCAYRLWQDPSFTKGILTKTQSADITKVILLRTITVILVIVGLIWIVQPEYFFAFPRQRPFMWIAVMVLYPFLSALPQEFIYRTYFFHKYDNLMALNHSTIIASAAAFSFLHIIYDNWWAVGLSFIAGLLFGITYDRTKSLFWVTVEHAIYGCIVFTLGFGNYFYEPF
jgi:membrane protease YdiL (CAAX protease family)